LLTFIIGQKYCFVLFIHEPRGTPDDSLPAGVVLTDQGKTETFEAAFQRRVFCPDDCSQTGLSLPVPARATCHGGASFPAGREQA
jgi:hypothetical protein